MMSPLQCTRAGSAGHTATDRAAMSTVEVMNKTSIKGKRGMDGGEARETIFIISSIEAQGLKEK